MELLSFEEESKADLGIAMMYLKKIFDINEQIKIKEILMARENKLAYNEDILTILKAKSINP